MPRLIDDIRATRRLEMPWFIEKSKAQDWAAYAQVVGQIVQGPDLPVILADNVADFYYSAEQEHWDLAKDFPNIAPPYPNFWLEHKTPRLIHSKECGDTDLAAYLPRGRVGVLLNSIDPKRSQYEGELPEGTHWLLWGDIFIDYGEAETQGPHGATFFAVDQDGRLVGTPWMQTYSGMEHAESMKALITWFHPALLSVCFLHCKNVKVQEESVDKPLAKKYHAKTGRWPTKYKTLVIEPLKQILRTQGRSSEVGIQRALHICRGHFADYTQGAGLFGKYHGRFWIPQTVRGTAKGKEKTPPAREIEVKL
jgi:hypothetical protein